MWHAVVIDQSLKESTLLENYKVFAKKQDGDWGIYGLEISDEQMPGFVVELQKYMKEGTWYGHYYNNDEWWVVFKDAVFGSNDEQKLREYGLKLGIPVEQLQVCPKKFTEEKNYFISQ